MKPMLAFKTKPGKVAFPVFIQPKYNGVRALYLPTHKNLQSRDENIWEPSVVAHITSQLTRITAHLDGELYSHGLSLQQINSRIAVNRLKPHDKAAEVKYYIYDILSTDPMWKRVPLLERLRDHFADSPSVEVAETHLANSQVEVDHYYAQWKAQGYEGLMYRTYDAPYGFAANCGNKENRWWHLQKLKEMQDLEATIEDVYEGNDGFAGMLGGFNCVTDEGIHFNAGGGLDLQQRGSYWERRDTFAGKRIRINFEMFSDGRVPLKPIIECIYE